MDSVQTQTLSIKGHGGGEECKAYEKRNENSQEVSRT